MKMPSSYRRSVVIHLERVSSSARLEFLERTEAIKTFDNLVVSVHWVVVDKPNLTWELRQRALQIVKESSQNGSFERVEHKKHYTGNRWARSRRRIRRLQFEQ
jgi:hypothetical protein